MIEEYYFKKIKELDIIFSPLHLLKQENYFREEYYKLENYMKQLCKRVNMQFYMVKGE